MTSSKDVIEGRERWCVEHGDAIETMRAMPPGSIDAIVTDPPYGIGYRSKVHGAVLNDRAPYIWWALDGKRVLRRVAPVLCFARWDVAFAFQAALGWAGFRVRQQLVWDRGYGSPGDCARTFAPSHDVVILACSGDWKRPAGAKRVRDLMSEPKVHYTAAVHPTEKPVELMRRLIRATTSPEDVVLDPFAGSGSTLVAALLEGRRAIGIEMESRHVETARRRCEEAAGATASAR